VEEALKRASYSIIEDDDEIGIKKISTIIIIKTTVMLAAII